MEDENVIDEFDEEQTTETIIDRHRREKKVLLAEIQKIRHSVATNDKKKKKESQEQITKLEIQLKDRHEKELEDAKNSQLEVDGLAEGISGMADGDSIDSKQNAEAAKIRKKMEKAQKRRDNKAAKNKERDAQIKQQELDNLTGKRYLETQKIKHLLSAINLNIYEIPSDGNCLYNAVSHQMQHGRNIKINNASLRSQTANYMKENVDNFLPFLTKLDTCDPYTLEEYENYCEDIANTSSWAGHLEIQAIAHVLKCTIKIIQAEGPPIVLGEEYETFTVVLPYHRHIFGLGEHYNSVEPKSAIDGAGNT